jgi:hypothetical protein
MRCAINLTEIVYTFVFRLHCFASDTTRYINWVLDLEFPARGRPVEFEITAIWYQGNSTSSWEKIFRAVHTHHIEGDWTWSSHEWGYGCDDPVGCWEVGSYRVDLYVAGKMIASAPFEIYCCQSAG